MEVNSSLLGYVIGYVVGGPLVISLLWAAVLRVAVKKLFAIAITYARAYFVCLIALVVGSALGYFLEFLVPVSDQIQTLWYWASFFLVLLAYSAITGSMLRDPVTGPIGIKKAAALLGIKFIATAITGLVFVLLWVLARVAVLYFT